MSDYRNDLKRILEKDVSSGRVAGNQLLVIREGQELFYHEEGYADAEKRMGWAPDTICRLFSMSKPVTSAAVMILLERGMLSLLDPVSRYLPEFADLKVLGADGQVEACKRPLLISDLMNMTSGIPYPENWEGCSRSGILMDRMLSEVLPKIVAGEGPSTREMAGRIAQVPLVFQPGERWMYGFGADVLGALVEVVSGRRFGTFLKEEIFDRLQMPDTGFFVPEDKTDRFAMSYEYDAEGKLFPICDSHLGEYYKEDVRFESGGAGLVSTIRDYSHFAQMLAQGGTYSGQRILGEATVRFMAQNRLKPEQMAGLDWDSNFGYGYGNLMRVLIDQGRAGISAPLGEFGWDGWTGNYVSMDPVNCLVILYFTQLRGGDGSTEIMRRIKNVVYGSL